MAQEQDRQKRFSDFLTWFKKHCSGKERAEGQIFFERLLQSFGNAGLLEAGAVCEDPVKKKSGKTGFADLVWRPRVIIELKQRGTNLKKHYPQAEEYWMRLVPNRPQYMILCNFDEFWIYDLNTQLNDPVHILKTESLLSDYGALAFLFPQTEKPIFNNNNVEVTEEAARIVGAMYLSLQKRKIDPHHAQRFVLQLVVALFAEDVGLIPKYTLQKILREAVKNPVTQKELTRLFQAMATEQAGQKPKEYREIPYFNGGLFNSVESFELTFNELDLLARASDQNWSKVRPSIFGAIFESSMDPNARHGHGVHFTSELDIQKIVGPTIVRPFRKKIQNAKNKKELASILSEIQGFKVLDPACGSGNFLYIAFRELRRLEIEVLETMDKNFDPKQMRFGLISPKNFFGIDTNEFGLELAKVALCIGRKLSADEFGFADNVLPFDNLDSNFVAGDAILSEWPKVDAIVGNPPFQSKNKMLQEFGPEYLNLIRRKMPDVSGNSDYCVYWFRKAHKLLERGKRAGLVGTNTIRQNYSRESGLDFIVGNGGTITEAVATQVWSGDAVVHVSIVNWVKGNEGGRKKLFVQNGDTESSPWQIYELDSIPSNLSPNVDVTSASQIESSSNSGLCFQGQTPGHEGFMLDREIAQGLIKANQKLSDVLFPFLIGDDFLGEPDRRPQRYVIDFGDREIQEAAKFKNLFEKVKNEVLPWREQMASKEQHKNNAARKKNPKAKIDRQYANALNRWWLLRRTKAELISSLAGKKRYIATSRVTKRPIFEFVSSRIHPGDSLQVFLLEDDYSFGILQSIFHWAWFTEKGSSLKGDPRYTSETVFDTYPWPQNPSLKQVKEVAVISRELYATRLKLLEDGETSLRQIYRNLELPGANKLKDIHAELNAAVSAAYGFKPKDTPLKSLLALNKLLSSEERDRLDGPGLPRCVSDPKPFISSDCIEA